MRLNRKIKIIFILFPLFVPQVTFAAEPDAFDYDHVSTSIFWNGLYPTGGWTLYCGYRFDSNRKIKDGKAVVIDHIYATDWMIKHLKCKDRLQCHENNEKFKRMEADMHNLYPIWQGLVLYRNAHPFGEIPGEDWRFDDCDFEWNGEKVEPRPIARGNIARAIFYMHAKYQLPITADMLKVLKEWNREDPPSQQEKERNDRIEKLQGQRNPYIDNPSLADKLQAQPH